MQTKHRKPIGDFQKLSDKQQRELRRMYDTGEYSISDVAELVSVLRPTIYRALDRQQQGGQPK